VDGSWGGLRDEDWRTGEALLFVMRPKTFLSLASMSAAYFVFFGIAESPLAIGSRSPWFAKGPLAFFFERSLVRHLLDTQFPIDFAGDVAPHSSHLITAFLW
jgi:hypothetical protein